MHKCASLLWRQALAGLSNAFDPKEVETASARIDEGRMPQDYYNLHASARLLIIGLGCGVSVFRQATWAPGRRIVCVESNPRALRIARHLAADLGLKGISFVGTLHEAQLSHGESFDMLMFEPAILNHEELRALISGLSFTSIIGGFVDEMADEAALHQMCSAHCNSFHLVNLSTNSEIVGRRRGEIDVSAIVVAKRSDAHLERCMRSLVKQTLARREIIVAYHPADAALVGVIERWQMEFPGIVRGVPVDFNGPGLEIAEALNAARGAYVAFIDSDDWCDAQMLERLYRAAAPAQAELVASAYYLVRYDDGSVESRFDIREIDLRKAGGPLAGSSLIEDEPTLGRFLFSRDFVIQNHVVWPVAVSAPLQNVAFQAMYLVAANRVVTIPDAYYYRRELISPRAVPPVHGATEIHSVVDLLRESLLREGTYARELVFKQLILRLYMKSYFGQRKLQSKISVLRSMLKDISRCSFFGGWAGLILTKAFR